ncbi:MAG TPA: DUF5667 domain-containing protein, partial [Mycobacteriales bacterium]|nr:DUF5667 domain-containing protein [Mycobacteriales bacterium]
MELTRRAEHFDTALREPAGALVPRQAGGLQRELQLATALRAAGSAVEQEIAPSEQFRTALRGRLLAVAAVQGVGASAPAPAPAPVSWRLRAATVAAGVMASAVAVTGVSVAASSSLPGDPFYALKRTTEGLQLRLADGAQEEGERHLQFAAARMQELRMLALGRDLSGELRLSPDDAGRVESVLDDMDAETRSGARLLTEAFRALQDPAPADRLARFADAQRAGLEEVLAALPDQSRTRARDSLALVSTVGTAATDLLVLLDCAASCDPASAAPSLLAPSAGAGPADPCSCPAPPPAPAVAPPPAPGPAPADGSGGEPAPASPEPAPP